jgi:hypothetical protein
MTEVDKVHTHMRALLLELDPDGTRGIELLVVVSGVHGVHRWATTQSNVDDPRPMLEHVTRGGGGFWTIRREYKSPGSWANHPWRFEGDVRMPDLHIEDAQS